MISSQIIIKIRADVFLREAVVEPAVVGFVAKSVVCVMSNPVIIVDPSGGKCMEMPYIMTFKCSLKIGDSEQEKRYHLLIYIFIHFIQRVSEITRHSLQWV